MIVADVKAGYAAVRHVSEPALQVESIIAIFSVTLCADPAAVCETPRAAAAISAIVRGTLERIFASETVSVSVAHYAVD